MSQVIIQFYMVLRNGVKIYHWNTMSHPRHKATDKFVENIDKLTDSFVEVYMGRYGRDPSMSKDMHLTLPGFTEKSIVTFLEESRVWLEKEIPKLIKPKDTDLFNIRDEILAEINQTLYLFTLK